MIGMGDLVWRRGRSVGGGEGRRGMEGGWVLSSFF